MYSPLITVPHRNRILAPENSPTQIRDLISQSPNPLLSEFPLLLSGNIKLNIPVYTVYGACEDVAVIERFRAGQYNIENLHVVDEATTRCVDVGGVKFRILGLGGAFVPHKLFDNGDGQATIAGGQGTMWTTALQIGELVDTAQRVYDNSETRILVSHASPGREGLIAQLALVVKADLTISAGLHFRYPTSYNEFSVQSDFEGFRKKLIGSKENFEMIWDAVKGQVEAVLDDNQKILLEKALSVVERIPPPVAAGGSADENAWKNCWNWNLTDAAYGQLTLDVKEGRVNAEMRSQGFNYAYRRQATPTTASAGGLITGTGGADGLNAPPNVTLPGSAIGTKPGTPGLSKSPAPTTNARSTPSVSKAGTPAPVETDASGAASREDKEREKREKRKQKEKEKRAEKAAERAAAGNSDVSAPKKDDGRKETGKKANGAPKLDTTSQADGSATAEEAGSTLSPGAEAGGAITPTARRGSRSPWTLSVKHLPIPVTEDEIKDFFGEAKSGIIHVRMPSNNPGSKAPKHLAFVEFADEEAMKAGLEKRADKLREATPHVSIDEGPGGAGRGRGRGSFARRELVAAGLGRQASGRAKPLDEEN